MAAALPIIAMVGGSVLSAVGSAQEGRDAMRAGQFEADQLNQQAGQTEASAQREAIEQRRQARLVNSRLRSLAGGGGSDETIVKLSGDIEAEGEYRALTSLYQGEERAKGMRMQAEATMQTAKAQKRAANIKAVTGILNAGASLYGKYK